MKYRTAVATTVLLACFACSKKNDTPAAGPDKNEKPPTPVQTQSIDAGAHHSSGMTWVEEDYDKALALAKSKGQPLVIDAWMAWCHTCMDMEKRVLTEAALGPLATEFVWLRIDREKPENAALMARFPIAVAPTYYIVDSKDEAILGRQLGGCNAKQYKEFLSNAQAAAKPDAAPQSPADKLLVKGSQAGAAGNDEEATKLFAKARAAAPEGWPRLPELLLNQLTQLHNQKKYEECALFAVENIPHVTKAPAMLGIMSFQAEMCVRELKKKSLAKKVRQTIVKSVDESLTDDSGPAVERGEPMQMKRYALLGLGLEEEAVAMAEKEAEMFDAAIKNAASPRAAMPFHIANAEVYAFLRRQAEYIPILEKATAELPLEYHIKFLLGQLYYFDERYEDAQQKIERALELSYGPQRGIIHAFLAEVYAAQGEVEKEAEARKAVLAFYESLPVGHRRAAELEAAKEALANISGKE